MKVVLLLSVVCHCLIGHWSRACNVPKRWKCLVLFDMCGPWLIGRRPFYDLILNFFKGKEHKKHKAANHEL